MRSPSLQIIRTQRGLKISGGAPRSWRRQLRQRVMLMLLLLLAVLTGWIGGWGSAWERAREPLVIKTPVFVRVVPSACVFEAWSRVDDPDKLPAGAVRALHMTDPVRSRGWAPCWPLFEAINPRAAEARYWIPSIGRER